MELQNGETREGEVSLERERSRSSLDFLQKRLHRWSISSAQTEPQSTIQPVEGKGPLGLTVLSEPSEPRIDFIFIHGLNGGSRKTWSHMSNPFMFWPKMWLPNEPGFKHVRIHSFGYNADWTTKRDSPLTVHDFGQALLADIFNSPTLKKNGDTPIVLVAHSMGGLVAKKAYLLATRDPTYLTLAQRMHTIFFLGTPHRGADSAQLAKLLRHSATYGTKAFIDDLLPGSGTLDQLNDEFRHVCDKLHVWSFTESLPTKMSFITTVIVDKASAVLGLPKEHVQYLEANHRDLCKFDSPANPNYMILQRAFLTTIETIEADASFQRRDEYRVQMNKIASHLRVDQRPDAIQLATSQKQQIGSCQWLTNHITFQGWLMGFEGTPKSPGILWLTGRPGSGKSVACSHVIRHLQACNLDYCFYFFSSKDKSGIDVSTLLRSLAFQMAESDFEVRHALASIADEMRINYNDYNMLWETLFKRRILKMGHKRPWYWVIDAIDECSSKELPALVSMLSSLDQQRLIRIFITSRPGGQLERLFTQQSTLFSEIQTGQSGSLGDIELFVKTRCSIPDSTEAMDALTAEIVDKSNGNFLWASLTVSKLEDAYSIEDKQAVLREIPREMEEFYSLIVSRIAESPSFELAKCILQWVICSPRPLTVLELGEAVRLDIKRTLTASASQLESLTGHLVYVDARAVIHLTHQTTLVFLTQKRDGFWLDRTLGNSRIAQICLDLLCGSDFAPPKVRRGGRGPRSSVPSALSEYAAFNFSHHLVHGSSSSDALLVSINKFLRSNVLSWIEKMAASNSLWVLLLTSSRLKTYLARRAKYQPPVNLETQTVTGWASDLYHIAAAFHTNLAASPSSIYRLIPHLCPPTSMIRTLFAKTSRGPRIAGPVEKDWSDRLMCHLFSGDASAIACSSRFLAIGLASGEIKVFHVGGSLGFHLAATLNHENKVRQLAFDHSSSLLVSCSARKLMVWDTSGSGAPQPSLRWTRTLNFTPFSVALTMDDAFIVLTNPQDSAVVQFTTQDGHMDEPTLLHSLLDSDSEEDGMMPAWTPSDRIRLDPEQRLAAVAYRNASISIWELETGENIGTFEKQGFEDVYSSPQTLDMFFNPVADVELLAVTYKDGDIVTCNPWTLEQECIYHLHSSLASLTATTDGRILAGAAEDGRIYLFLFETLQPLHHIDRLDGQLRINSLCFSPDNRQLLDIRGQSCNVWEPLVLIPKTVADDGSSEPFSEEVPMPESNASHAHDFQWGEAITVIEPAGNDYLFAGRQDGSIDVIDCKSGETIKNLPIHDGFTEITHLQWDATKGRLMSLDSMNRYIITAIPDLTGPARGSCLIDRREESFVRQVLLNSEMGVILLQSDTEAKTLRLDGTIVGGRILVTAWWTLHPSNASLLVATQQNRIMVYSHHLQHQSTISCSLLCPTPSLLDNCWTTATGSNYLIRSQAYPNCGDLTVIDMSVLSDDAQEVTPLVIRSNWLNMHSVLGCLKTTLFFLDTDGWVCSINIKNIHEASHYSRHFFIPLTWRTGPKTVLRVLSKSTVAYGWGEQLIVFHGFLEFEESVAFRV